MQTRPRGARPGFTLIEMAMVVIILGIISSIFFSRWADSQKKARIAVLQNDLKSLATVMELDFQRKDNDIGYRWPLPADGDQFVASPDVTAGPIVSSIDPTGGFVSLARSSKLAITDGLCSIVGAPAMTPPVALDGGTPSMYQQYRCNP